MKSSKLASRSLGALLLVGLGLPVTGREEKNMGGYHPPQFAQVGRQTDPVGQRREEARKADTGAQRTGNEAGRQDSQGSLETQRRENEALRRIQEPTQFERQREPALERQQREFYESQKATAPEQQKPEQQKKVLVLGGCSEGYVWREAIPGDHVCVTPGARSQVQRDNNQALDRRDPKGANGPNTCVEGYVWREAAPGDQVCVTSEARAQAARDNGEAVNRISR